MHQTHFIWTAPTNETLAAGKFGQIEKGLNICTKEKILRNQVAVGKLRVLRAITQHSLGNNSPEVGSRPSSPVEQKGTSLSFSACVTLASRWPWCDLGQLGGQSNRRHGVLSLGISPAPGRSQPYTHSWQFLGTIVETCF